MIAAITRARLGYIVPVALFAALTAAFAVGLTTDPRHVPSALIDKPAPEFVLPPLGAKKPLLSADLKGDVTLVNIFASWCVPCRVEHPLLLRLARDRTVVIFGINYKDRPEAAIEWLGQLGDPYSRIGADRDGRVGIEWGVYGVPETFVIDRAGRIRYKHIGPLTPEAVDKTIVPLIQRLKG